MSEVRWYRSLYWRIAFGFIALLAALLVVQAGIFLWLTVLSRSSGPAPELARLVASDLSAELAHDRGLALDTYLPRRFSHVLQPFLVVLDDGRAASNRPNGLPPGFARMVRGMIHRAESADASPPRQGHGPAELAPIVVNGTVLGFVAVPSNPVPFPIVLREVGPTLIWVAIALFAVGASVMALVIFRPARKRLQRLEQAARALGEGRTDVRALDGGGDEVSALARTFNRMADDLGARASALAESDRVRRQLLADVSHELMTPLSAIRGYVETLAMPDLNLDDPTRRKYLAIVEDEARLLEAIIGDLLELARLEGGGGALARDDVRISDLFDRVMDRHDPALRAKQITIRTRVDPKDLAVRGDAQRLEQAVQNLAANALRHTPEGGRIELNAAQNADGVHIAVRDTGPGIPPEHLTRVFDRFYKVDPSRTGTTAASGSGLGLSIVRAIVVRHGGTVQASNALDGGAVFEITIPVVARDSRLGARDSGLGVRRSNQRAANGEP